MPDSGLSVNLSFELAKQIYDSWMVTQNEMKTSRRKMTNIISSGSIQMVVSTLRHISCIFFDCLIK